MPLHLLTVFAVLASLLVAASPALAGSGAASSAKAQKADEAALTEVVSGFNAATTTRDAAAIEALLHRDFRVVFVMRSGSPLSTMARAAWFQMLADGKLGGAERSFEARDVSVEAGLGFLTATMRGASGEFVSRYTLVKGDAGWQIVQEAVVFQPPAK